MSGWAAALPILLLGVAVALVRFQMEQRSNKDVGRLSYVAAVVVAMAVLELISQQLRNHTMHFATTFQHSCCNNAHQSDTSSAIHECAIIVDNPVSNCGCNRLEFGTVTTCCTAVHHNIPGQFRSSVYSDSSLMTMPHTEGRSRWISTLMPTG